MNLDGLIHYDVVLPEHNWAKDLRVWREFPPPLRFVMPPEEALSSMEAELSNRMISVMHHFEHEGHQVFAVGPVMQELFDECHLDDVPETSMWDLPYDCFYVALPDCRERLYNAQTGNHQVAGCYVQRFGKVIRLLIWGKANEKSVAPDDDAAVWVDLAPEKMAKTIEDGVALVNIEQYLGSIPFQQGKWSLSWMEQVKAKRAFQFLSRQVFNLLLYINSVDPDVDTQKPDPGAGSRAEAMSAALAKALKKGGEYKAKKLKKRLAKIQRNHITWVGPRLEAAGSRAASAGTSKSLHRRRGHRHRYWVGSRTAEDGSPRKGEKMVVKFVAPQWVGGDKARREDEIKDYRGRTYRPELERGGK